MIKHLSLVFLLIATIANATTVTPVIGTNIVDLTHSTVMLSNAFIGASQIANERQLASTNTGAEGWTRPSRGASRSSVRPASRV